MRSYLGSYGPGSALSIRPKLPLSSPDSRCGLRSPGRYTFDDWLPAGAGRPLRAARPRPGRQRERPCDDGLLHDGDRFQKWPRAFRAALRSAFAWVTAACAAACWSSRANSASAACCVALELAHLAAALSVR